MQFALAALLLLTPAAAAMGIQVVTFRMAFFADAISHSAFLGVAIGVVSSIEPRLTMPLLGILVGVVTVAYVRSNQLPSDTTIGVVFAAVVAAGLAVISRHRGEMVNIQRYVYGDVLTLRNEDLWVLLFLFVLVAAFQLVFYNRSIMLGVSSVVAQVHGVPVMLIQYAFAVLVSLVVMLSVQTVGVFLVTAMLIVPASAARNLARSAGTMFWWAQLVAITSACAGLGFSTLPSVGTAPGAMIVLVAFMWFVVSSFVARRKALRRAM